MKYDTLERFNQTLKIVRDVDILCSEWSNENSVQYDITRNNRVVGRIILNLSEISNEVVMINSMQIFSEYRFRGIGTDAIYKLCKLFPDVTFHGLIIYPDVVSFWAQFDRKLQNLKTYYDKLDFCDKYGYFAFHANDI